jgi:TldD protein
MLMPDLFQLARIALLEPAGITEQSLSAVLEKILSRCVDYADLYFQETHSEAWALEDGIIKSGEYHLDRGVGVRVLHGEKTGFAYADDILLPALTQAANTASSIVNSGQNRSVKSWQRQPGQHLYLPNNPLNSWDEQQKVAFLHKLNAYLQQLDNRIVQSSISLLAEYDSILVVSSEGILAADIRPLVRLNISVVLEEQGKRENGYAGCGGRYDYNYFTTEDEIFAYARAAVAQANLNLQAIPAPAGTIPVVLGSGWPGVLIHEAVGHGLEGDFNRKGVSVYSGKLGQLVASPLCTVVDNGTLPQRRGSLNVDDEGTPTQCTTLIDNGVLANYLQDRRNANLMQLPTTGNGRRESYAHLPMPRMTNTYLLPGASDPEEIIASVDYGLYAANFSGGQVDITSGKFVFSTAEAYLIEKGQITTAVKGATLIGNGPEVLKNITMVGNNLALDSGIGICGKDGQSVPVGVGMPTVKVNALTVGGTNTNG